MININQIKQMMNMIRFSQNPRNTIAEMARQNPAVANAIQYVQKCGGDPKQAFYSLAKERGVDPESILNQLR